MPARWIRDGHGCRLRHRRHAAAGESCDVGRVARVSLTDALLGALLQGTALSDRRIAQQVGRILTGDRIEVEYYWKAIAARRVDTT